MHTSMASTQKRIIKQQPSLAQSNNFQNTQSKPETSFTSSGYSVNPVYRIEITIIQPDKTNAPTAFIRRVSETNPQTGRELVYLLHYKSQTQTSEARFYERTGNQVTLPVQVGKKAFYEVFDRAQKENALLKSQNPILRKRQSVQ